MSPVEPRSGEKKVLDEDCAEDSLKNGILILTNQRIIFQKTEGTLLTLSKKADEVAVEIPLHDIVTVKAEGRIATKLLIATSDKSYKFSVYSNRKWAKAVAEQIEIHRSST